MILDVNDWELELNIEFILIDVAVPKITVMLWKENPVGGWTDIETLQVNSIKFSMIDGHAIWINVPKIENWFLISNI